jgi:uncharacterized protein
MTAQHTPGAGDGQPRRRATDNPDAFMHSRVITPTIATIAGKEFNFNSPDACYFGIFEIAHALSQICRFTGHTRSFYSVAQHSVLVSRLVKPELAAAALMHDAHEAFVGDVSSPLKSLLPEYKAIEHRVETAVRRRFGLPIYNHPDIKRADLVALLTEQRDLMPAVTQGLFRGIDLVPHEEHINPVGPREAFDLFFNRAWEINMAGLWPTKVTL